MSYLKQLKKKVEFEETTMCGNCAHFRPPKVYLTTDSQTRLSRPVCGLHWFTVTRTKVCNDWKEKE